MISTGTCRIKSLLNNSVTHFGHPLGLLPSSSNVITHKIVVIGSNLHYLIQFLIPCHLKFYKKKTNNVIAYLIGTCKGAILTSHK